MSEYLNIIPQCECTGCGACSAICPHKCIEMTENRVGFSFPTIDAESCVNCGMCNKACPVLNSDSHSALDRSVDVYAAKNLDCGIALKSSSGGIFSIVAEDVLRKGGTVYGVEMTPTLKASHIRIENIEKLGRIRGSKYLHSSASPVFPLVKSDLRDGKYVLFSGTPCQIAGLRQYLQKDYAKLLCIEVVCHGVPTNLAFRRYIEGLEAKHGARIVKVNFRDKSKGWQEYRISYWFDNGYILKKRHVEDLYFKGYVNNLFIRDNCLDCKFKGAHSRADIILGDMWGIKSIIPSYEVGSGVSMICINSSVGKEVFNEIKNRLADCVEVDYASVEKYNPCISHSVTAGPERSYILKLLSSGQFFGPVKKVLGINSMTMLRKRYMKAKNRLIGYLVAIKHFVYNS